MWQIKQTPDYNQMTTKNVFAEVVCVLCVCVLNIMVFMFKCMWVFALKSVADCWWVSGCYREMWNLHLAKTKCILIIFFVLDCCSFSRLNLKCIHMYINSLSKKNSFGTCAPFWIYRHKGKEHTFFDIVTSNKTIFNQTYYGYFNYVYNIYRQPYNAWIRTRSPSHNHIIGTSEHVLLEIQRSPVTADQSSYLLPREPVALGN